MPFQVEVPSSRPKQFTVPRCGICKLYKHCKSPKMPVYGKGRKKILIVGEAPGASEDDQNIPFVGKAGQFQQNVLLELGIDMARDCWLYNSLICRPPNNRTPTSEEISYCKPNLTRTINELQPNVIIPVGRAAVESVVSGIWLEDIGTMARWVGWNIPCRDLNAWICPTYHPSYVMREIENAYNGTPVREMYLRHLRKAIKHTRKPYKIVPDEEIEIILDPVRAAKAIHSFRRLGTPVGFDYETSCLKPDRGGKIISVGISNGDRTIAFPYYGSKVKSAWKWLMASRCPKIAHNAKFEDRWSRCIAELEQVVNWVWCSMIGTHLADNRKAICSLGFQAFVQLGVGTYGEDISKLLEQKHSYGSNRIKEADLTRLLTYNGKDALYTYLIAEKQRKFFGLPEWK